MNRILRDQSGAGVIEYALIVALVAVVACAALALLGQRVGVLQNRSSTALPG
jgi:Flp pilus assembly pilin Flp